MLLAMSAFAQGSENDGRSGTWSHNDSTIALYENGNRRVFKYDVPRKGMVEEGVRHGTVLFDGFVTGDQIVGTSRLFSRRCGKSVAYNVSGMVSGQNITMFGKAPRLGPQCEVAETHDMVLSFNFVRPPPAPIVVSPPPQPDYSGPLRQQNAQLRDALSTAQSRATAAEAATAELQNQLKLEQGRSTVIEKPVYIDRPVHTDTPGTMIRGLMPSIMVALISFAIQIAKNKLKIGMPTGKEIMIETAAAAFTSLLMVMIGASKEITLFAIPFLGGLFSMGLMMSVKHLVDNSTHHHHYSQSY
jgi:hypothetical protein